MRIKFMKGASKKSISQVDKYIEGLMGDTKIMGQAKAQLSNALKDFKNILNDPKSGKNLAGLAERGMDKFSKMLEKFNEFN